MNFRVFSILPVAEYFAIFQNFHPSPKVYATMCKNVQQWTGTVKISTGPREKNKCISEVSVTDNQGEVSPNVASSWTWDPIKTLRQKVIHTQKDCILKHHSQPSEQKNRLAIQLSILAFLTDESVILIKRNQLDQWRSCLFFFFQRTNQPIITLTMMCLHSKQCAVLWPAVNNGENKQAVHMYHNTEEPVMELGSSVHLHL